MIKQKLPRVRLLNKKESVKLKICFVMGFLILFAKTKRIEEFKSSFSLDRKRSKKSQAGKKISIEYNATSCYSPL